MTTVGLLSVLCIWAQIFFSQHVHWSSRINHKFFFWAFVKGVPAFSLLQQANRTYLWPIYWASTNFRQTHRDSEDASFLLHGILLWPFPKFWCVKTTMRCTLLNTVSRFFSVSISLSVSGATWELNFEINSLLFFLTKIFGWNWNEWFICVNSFNIAIDLFAPSFFDFFVRCLVWLNVGGINFDHVCIIFLKCSFDNGRDWYNFSNDVGFCSSWQLVVHPFNNLEFLSFLWSLLVDQSFRSPFSEKKIQDPIPSLHGRLAGEFSGPQRLVRHRGACSARPLRSQVSWAWRQVLRCWVLLRFSWHPMQVRVGVGNSEGSRSSMTQIRSSRRSCPVVHGTVWYVLLRMTAISSDVRMCVVWSRRPLVAVRTDRDPGDVRVQSRSVVEKVEVTLNGDLVGGTAPLRQDPRFVSRTTGLPMGVPQFAQWIACMCASSAWNHTGQLNAQGTQDGHLQQKVSGRARARTRPRNDCV